MWLRLTGDSRLPNHCRVIWFASSRGLGGFDAAAGETNSSPAAE